MDSEPECNGCGNGGRKLEMRPVILTGKDEPRLVCSSCYQVLDGLELIDHERDAEVFGYAK